MQEIVAITATPQPSLHSASRSEHRRFTDLGLNASLLGFGAAPIGNLYTEVADESAVAAVQEALRCGINFFDTAPYYGYGLSERRLGRGLAGTPRDSFVLSTKVGRSIVADDVGGQPGDGFAVIGAKAVFDYSHDGVMRSFDSSLERLGVDYIDVLLLHDIGRLTHGDEHPQRLRQALEEALPAMAELKASGACRAIGIGVNEEAICLELMPLFPLDCIMLAGRYTLLEQEGSRGVMDEALRRSVAVLAAGPYNSGLLGDARRPGTTYNYTPVDPATLVRAQRIYDVCAAEHVDVGAAALQFPLAHPAVAIVVAGLRSAEEVRSAAARLSAKLPASLWAHLREAGLLTSTVMVPQ
jgi:D-threo-aldose 1-dehydrogenase